VGVPRQPVLVAAQGYDRAWTQALERLRSTPAEVVELDFEPLLAVARLLYEGPWVAERYATVQALLDERPEALDATVAAVIAKARQFSAVDTCRAQYQLQAARQKLAALWQDVDLLMVPTAPRHPSLGDLAAEPVAANALLGTYTNFVNLLGWSALALPSGTAAAGLPFGVTFIGQAHADAALARWGQQWQARTGLPLGATGRTPGAATAQPLWPLSKPTLPLAVVGAHLSGLPLNSQLLERGAVLRQATTTAPAYRLYALPGTTPPKPGLVRVAEGGASLAVEVWDMPLNQLGSFLALIPQPLGLGTLELADGSTVHGFLCENIAVQDARDISSFGGWRAFLAAAAAERV
jgi:allophanate hydrolase